MLKSVPESLLPVLSNLQTYFQENLLTDFKDHKERRCKRPPNFLDVPNVLTILESESRLMKNIKLMKQPNFKIQTFELSMKDLFIKLSLEIEQVLIEAQYEMFNNESQPTATDNKCGNIVFDVENILLNAIIPIYVEEDSFMACENFSMTMKPAKITTRKSSTIDGKVESSESVDNLLEASLIKVIWNGLSETINFLIRQDLGGSIVEYSVSELFADEPEEMVAFSNKRIEASNKVITNIFQKVSTFLSRSIVAIPELNLSYKSQTNSSIAIVCFQDGEMTNLSNIQQRPPHCIIQENNLIICGGFDLRDLTINFTNCWASCDGIVTTGNCKYIASRMKFRFKLLVIKKENKLCTKLDNLQLCWIRDTECNFNGMMSVDDIQDELKGYMDNFLEGEIAPLIVGYLKESFEGVLKRYKVGEDIKDIV